METLKIADIIRCNSTLYKMRGNELSFPMNVSFKIYQIIKLFDEVEDFVFNALKNVFGKDIDILNMTEQQKEVYDILLNSSIEIDIPKINKDYFKQNEKVNITIDDISNLQIIMD